MATVSDYTFDNLSRTGDDSCDISQRSVQNSSFGSYSTTNYFAKDCGMRQPIAFATTFRSM